METLEVKLSGGKVAVVKESTALEEVLGYQIVSSIYDEKSPMGAGVVHRAVMVLLSLVSVDDEPVDTPKSIDDVYMILGQFKKTDWKLIEKAYDTINEIPEDLTGE